MSGPVQRKAGWADLHEEVQAEFAALVGYDRLEVGTERHLSRKRLWEFEHKRWLTPVRRAYQRAYCRRDYVRAATRQRARNKLRSTQAQSVESACAQRRALSQRAPVACANPRCDVVFVPSDLRRRYCTRACYRTRRP